MAETEDQQISRAPSLAPTVPTQTPREDEETTSTRLKRKLEDMTGRNDATSQDTDSQLLTAEKSSAKSVIASATPTPGQRPNPENPLTPVKTPSHYGPRTAAQGHGEEQKSEEPEDLSEPEEPIEPFDWADLEDRFREKMAEQGQKEAEAYRDWENLMGFFSIWSNVPTFHEVERSTKRLRTRMTHVQHSESKLEDRRLHYKKVVNAFQSALDLFG